MQTDDKMEEGAGAIDRRPRREEYVLLDLMRGLAAFAVMAGHVRGSAWVDYAALPAAQRTGLVAAFFALTRLGQEAVMVFFVLSGFLVGGAVIVRCRSGAFDLGRYALERAARIYVPLIPACVLTEAIVVFVFHGDIAWSQLAATLVGLNGVAADWFNANPSLWTLSYEIWFYILGGAVGALFGTKIRSPAILLLCVGVGVFSVLRARYLFYWCLGASFVLASAPLRSGWAALAGAIVALIGVALCQIASDSNSFAALRAINPDVGEAVLCVGVSLLLPWCCTAAAQRLAAPLAGFSAWIASFSYTLYLVHYPINQALSLVAPKYAALSGESILMFAFRIAVCVVASIALFYLAERHTAALRGWIRRRVRSRAPA